MRFEQQQTGVSLARIAPIAGAYARRCVFFGLLLIIVTGVIALDLIVGLTVGSYDRRAETREMHRRARNGSAGQRKNAYYPK
jgi:hypothetical protein